VLSLSAGLKSWAHSRLATIYRSWGDLELSGQSLKAALALEPSNTKAKSMLTEMDRVLTMADLEMARDRINCGNPDEAAGILETIVALDPTHAEAHYLLALAIQSSGSNRTKALVHYRSALDQGFSPFWIRYNRGQLYDALGDKTRALEDFEEALGSPPTDMASDHEMLEWLREEIGNRH